MSKTVATATISTQCGFTNGAGRTVALSEEKMGARNDTHFVSKKKIGESDTC